MVRDTKRRQLQNARDSGPAFGTRIGGSKYEVVAGARRLRAAKLAELEKLPVRVVKLTDAEAIEAQCVELSVVGKIFLC
jgi:ParB-like nuclease domain